jgi:hypothetical protein
LIHPFSRSHFIKDARECLRENGVDVDALASQVVTKFMRTCQHAVKLAARKDADLDRNASDFRIHSEAETSPHRMEFCIQASDAVATDYK